MVKKETFSKHFALFTYDISHLKGSNKVRFVYVLKGRDKSIGLVEELNGRFLVPGCFIVPIEKDKQIQEVMKQWNVSFNRIEMLTR